MTSLADRLAAASRDRATTAPATTDAMSGMSERRGTPESKAENEIPRPSIACMRIGMARYGPGQTCCGDGTARSGAALIHHPDYRKRPFKASRIATMAPCGSAPIKEACSA